MTRSLIGRPYAVLGSKIRAARELTGLSQERFAPEVGVTRRHLIRIEGGNHNPGPALLDRIAERTGVSRSSLTNSDETDSEAAQVRNLSLDEFLRLRIDAVLAEQLAAAREGARA